MDIVMASLAASTLKQYNSSLSSWWIFCNQNDYDYLNGSVTVVLLFLTDQFQKGANYSTINTCHSALSLLLGKDITNNESISRFIKGVFRLRPTQPKYHFTWDPHIVLIYFSNLFPYDNVSLYDLTIKTITLLAISSAQRMQTLSLIKLDNISIGTDDVTIRIDELTKTSKPGYCQPLISLPFIKEKPNICPALVLKYYIEKTGNLRKSTSYLFISFKKPHKAVSSQTLAHWVKKGLELSGIDISTFGAHSTRHASTSAAYRKGVNLESIRNAAGWTNKSNVFLKYYNKELQCNNDFVNVIFNGTNE